MAADPKTIRRLRLGAAFALLGVAFALFYFGQHIPWARMASMFILLLGVSISRGSRLASGASVDATGAGAARPPVRWWVGGGLFVLVGVAYWFLIYSEHHNFLFPYPIYLFAAAILAAAWWAFGLFTRWL
jgi:hypothetical protein